MQITIKIGATKDGHIKAIDLYTLSNTGAYGEHGPTTVGLSGHKSIPLYSKIEAFKFSYDVVYTNVMSAGAYRGYGATQGIFALESIIDELAAKLNRNLGNGYISGKGYLIASQCIEKGVDPYVAVAIMLHETGCKYNCSTLVRSCNNVGGQKGAPGCNGGSYKAYATLDDGIIGFINNLQRNYYAKGLNTIEKIAPRYAASSAWPTKIRSYVEQIRAN